MTKPERMTDEEFDQVFSATCQAPDFGEENCTSNIGELHEEARRARSREEQAGRERDAAVEQWHKDQAKIDALTDDIVDLSLQVDEWREHFDDVLCGFAFDLGGRVRRGFVPCAHCGWRSEIIPEDEINAAIREHIKTCPEHPMRAVEAERDSAQAVAKEAGRQLGEAGAEKLKAERERDLLERQIDEFALAIGYGVQVPGQSGIGRPSLAYIADLIKDERKGHDEALKFEDWAAEALDQWRSGEERLGPLDDALTAALDELEAKRAETKRLADAGAALFDEAKALHAEVERLKAELRAARMAEERQSVARALAEKERDTMRAEMAQKDGGRADT